MTESLGQVASQTLDIAAVNKGRVYHTCFGASDWLWPRQEIIRRAGTSMRLISQRRRLLIACTLFMPRRPETHARMREVLERGIPLIMKPVDDHITAYWVRVDFVVSFL